MYDDPNPNLPSRHSCSFQGDLATPMTALLTLPFPARLLQIFWSSNRKSLLDGSLHIPSATLRLAETGSYGGKRGKDYRVARSGESTERNDKIVKESLSKETQG